MSVKDEIIHLVKENVYVSAPVTGSSNLYTELGFDSLSYMDLLSEIEEAYSITFDIMEMETCLQVDRLIVTVENKIKERDNEND